MNLPIEINQRVLQELASPSDTTAIRVICTSAPNGSAYRLRGKRRQYVFERNNTVGAHVLDIPASLWQHDVPPGPYRENLSLCHDMQTVTGNKVPLVFMVVPWGPESTAVAAEALAENATVLETMPLLREFFTRVGAPPIVFEALDVIRDEPLDVFRQLVESIKPADGDAPPTPETAPDTTPAQASDPKPLSMDPTAIRMREMRKRKREEKGAAKKSRVTRHPQPV